MENIDDDFNIDSFSGEGFNCGEKELSLSFIDFNNEALSVSEREIDNLYFDGGRQKKLTKEDLKKMPLPLFGCLYCANEEVAFNHLVNENLTKQYLNCVSTEDMRNIDELIKTDLLKKSNVKKVNKLKTLVLENFEYLKKYYEKENNNLLKSIAISDNVSTNEIGKYFRVDNSRKICYSDIEFEEKPFDIWNCSYLFNETNEEKDPTFKEKKSFSFVGENNNSNSTSTLTNSYNVSLVKYKSNKSSNNTSTVILSSLNIAHKNTI